MPSCPKPDDKRFKDLAAKVGEIYAHGLYDRYNGDYDKMNANLTAKNLEVIWDKQKGDIHEMYGDMVYDSRDDAQSIADKINGTDYPLVIPTISKVLLPGSRVEKYAINLDFKLHDIKAQYNNATLNDLGNLFLTNLAMDPNPTEIEKTKLESVVNNAFNRLGNLDSPILSYERNGRDYDIDFTDDMNRLRDAQDKDTKASTAKTQDEVKKIIGEIRYRLRKEYLPNRIAEMGKFFDDVFKATFEDPDKKDKKYSATLKRTLRTITGFGTGNKVMKLGDFLDTYGIGNDAVNDLFKYDDTYIIVHSGDKKSDKVYISIMNTLKYSLDTKSGEFDSRKNILANFITDDDAKTLGIDMQCKQHSVEVVKNGLLALHMINQDPRIIVSRVGTVTRGYGNGRNNINTFFVEAKTAFDALNKMREVNDFRNSLHPVIKSLLANDKLFDNYDHTLSMIDAVMLGVQEGRLYDEEHQYNRAKDGVSYDDFITEADKYTKNGYPSATFMKMVYDRIKILDQKFNSLNKRFDFKTVKSIKAGNNEYVALCHLYLDLKSYARGDKEPDIKDINSITKWINLPSMNPNPINQDFLSIIRTEMEKTIDRYKQWNGGEEFGFFGTIGNAEPGTFQYHFNQCARVYADRNGIRLLSLVRRDQEKIFERIIKYEEFKTKVKQPDGSYIDGTAKVGHRVIYKAEDGPELTQEELEAGKFFVNSIRTQIKDTLKHNIIKNNFGNVPNNIDKLVDQEYASHWTDGLLPLIPMRPGEYIAHGRIGKSLTTSFHNYIQHIYEDSQVISLLPKSIDGNHVTSLFSMQFAGTSSDNLYGSDARMEMMGMKKINGEYYLKNENYKNFSKDLQLISKYFMMDSMWHNDMEDNVVPVKQMADIVLMSHGMIEKVDNALAVNDMLFQKLINTRLTPGKDKPMQALNMAMAGLYRMNSLLGVGYSIPTGLVSYIGNYTNTMLESIANSVKSPYGLFNFKQMLQGQRETVMNPNVTTAWFEGMQLMNQSKFEWTHNFRRTKGYNSIFSSHWEQFCNWFADYDRRRHVMVAQMIKDGTWNACDYVDGKRTYDIKQDKRLGTWNNDGTWTQSEEQKKMAAWIRRDRINDGLQTEEEGPDPTGPYAYRDQMKLKEIGNYVIGYFEGVDAPLMEMHMAPKMAVQFKRVLYHILRNRFGGIWEKNQDMFLATRTITPNEDGTDFKEEWAMPVDMPGAYVDMFNYFVKDNIVRMFKEGSFSKFTKLDDIGKHNAAVVGTDMLLMATVMCLFGINWSGDKNLNDMKKNSKFLTSFYNGLTSALVLSPRDIMKLGSISAFERAKSLMDIVSFNATKRDVTMNIPFYPDIKAVSQLVDNDDKEEK